MNPSGMRYATTLALLLMPLTAVVADISVTDDTGRTVQLDRPAERIISLAPNLTEALFAADAGDRLIAAVEYSDYPAAARDLPRVGTLDQPDMESIVGHDPDLIVAWGSGNPRQQVERLRSLGYPVYTSEILRLDAIPDTLADLGKLAGTEASAARAADTFLARLNALRTEYAAGESVDVFYQIWDDPLMTINGDHLISDVIAGCGGRNVFADMSSLAPRISVEAVLARDPEFILASGMGEQRPEWLDDWREWTQLRAVELDNLYFIPPDLLQRQTPRILEGMAMLCEQIEEARNR